MVSKYVDGFALKTFVNMGAAINYPVELRYGAVSHALSPADTTRKEAPACEPV